MKPSLKTNLNGLELENPVMTASGTFGYAMEFTPYMDVNRLGGIIVKGLSLEPSTGNPPPRIVETASGMLNAIGLENIGIQEFLKKKLSHIQKFSPPLVLNIYGKTADQYAELAAIIDDVDGVAGVEVNISCPNVKAGGVAFGQDPKLAMEVLGLVRQNTKKHMMVKLSPNVTDITLIAKTAQDTGADSLSLINTLTGLAVDIRTRRPKLANITGGLSGPAIKPVGLRMVWQAAKAVDIPVVGIGGIMNATDALEYLMVGASAIQVGTANFVDPATAVKVVDGIEEFLTENSIEDIQDFIGSFQTGDDTSLTCRK